MKSLLNDIFRPIIKKYDMYCIGIVLAQVVLFNFKFDDLKEEFKNEFKNLIQSLLFNEVDDVKKIINEIKLLISLI